MCVSDYFNISKFYNNSDPLFVSTLLTPSSILPEFYNKWKKRSGKLQLV